MNYKKSRIDEITELLLKVASGNYDIKGTVTERKDIFDAVIAGINMLAEELSSTVVSRNYLESIYKGISDILIVTDNNNKISKINPSVVKTLEYSEEELIGQNINILFKDEEKGFLSYADEYLIMYENLNNFETKISTKNNTIIQVSVSVSNLNDKDTKKSGKIYIARDIREQIELRTKLRLKNEALRTFIYKASHDLRGPLASIQGLLDLAIIEENTITKNEYLSMISQSSERLNKLLNDLIEFTMVSYGKLVISSTNIKNIIEGIINSLRYDVEAASVNIKLECNQNKIFKSDPKILNSILQNIIHNSLHYRRKDIDQPLIDINVIDYNSGVKVTVTDNGKGMKHEVLKNIYKMFYRGDAGSTGSGLGLFIVKNSLERLKGTIDIYSKPNEGTKTVIYIPSEKGKVKVK